MVPIVQALHPTLLLEDEALDKLREHQKVWGKRVEMLSRVVPPVMFKGLVTATASHFLMLSAMC